MKCPKCQTENPRPRKFCRECGEKLLLICPQCGFENLPGDKFCGECGEKFEEVVETEKTGSDTEAERKHVTVLFSDLSGYTAMTERLDPEEVKEITSHILGEVSKVIDRYEGFIEKFIGDAVMALFGVPKAHEDDPVRAIRAALEIHELVAAISPEIEKKIGLPISMHTGINTGLVVTGEVDTEKGTHGVAGDTINVASRLSGLAGADEILVGTYTYLQAEGYFNFQDLEAAKVKGKAESVQVYKVLSPKERPITMHRLSGLRADLIGRKAETAQLREAVENLGHGRGRIFSICGDAGTGKSRLVDEFKATLDPNEVQWLEGRAYAYAQNIPYFPLTDLFNKAFEIEEGDPPGRIREKVKSRVEDLLGETHDAVCYVGSLYSLSYPEIEEVSPEFWRARLQDSVLAILSALARRAPTIFCLEDLHWADPSFIELLRNALLQIRQPAVVLCVYRPAFSLFTAHQLGSIGKIYQEIRLQDLSASEAQDMLESLLKTETIPSDLRRFVQDKAEGNPFYLEELVNSLIESETLVRDDGGWRITRSIDESDISTTIHGVISGRLDRLENETKRIIQEASVIGRAFLYEILRRITEVKGDIDRCLRGLEQLDLIRTRSLHPDLEYMFKHALTQEVVYNGLLKKERKEIHERIAVVMERLFHERLPEFYETLAFHFKQGRSVLKAVDYLMKSGEKSLKRYAVEESQLYYKEAFDILANEPIKSREQEGLLIDLLIKWALVFYYRGDFKQLTELFNTYENLAESLDNKARLGMFYAWLGFAWYCRGKYKDSYQYLCRALQIGEEIENKEVIGYACAWLSWTCADFGLVEDAIAFGERAQEISRAFASDQYLYFKSLGGLGYAYYTRGETKALEIGRATFDYGQTHSNVRSMGMGQWIMAFGYILNGDLSSAIESCHKMLSLSLDPLYAAGAKLMLGFSSVSSGDFQEGEEVLQEVVDFSRNFGCETFGTRANLFLGVVSMAKGHMGQGLEKIQEAQRAFLENEGRSLYATSEHLLGKLYLQIVENARPISLSTMAKNVGFLIRNVPFAGRKAEEHFNKAIQVAREIGARGIMAMAYLDLGLLHKAKKRRDQARECLIEAIKLFEQCGTEAHLKQAKEALASLE